MDESPPFLCPWGKFQVSTTAFNALAPVHLPNSPSTHPGPLYWPELQGMVVDRGLSLSHLPIPGLGSVASSETGVEGEPGTRERAVPLLPASAIHGTQLAP